MLKKTIKVTYNGETKRVVTPNTFEELLFATKASFGIDAQAMCHNQFKFYILDEENELISISSQDDFIDNSEYVHTTSDDPGQFVPSLIFSSNATDVSNQL